MNKYVDKILNYRDTLGKKSEGDSASPVSRKQFTFLLSGVGSFRKVPGIHKHMGFEELYHCDSKEDAGLVREHLKRLFGIEDIDSLVRVCYTMFAAGGEYQQFMTFWKDAPVFDVSQLQPQGVKAFEMCKSKAGHFYPFLREKGFYAYDISEIITLCRIAVAGGIITDEQFYDITDKWVRMAQVFYNSYEEFAVSYLCGGIYDMSKYDDVDLDEYLALNMQILDILLKNDGPWQRSDWYKPEEREWVDLLGNNLGCFITKKAMDSGYIGYMYHSKPTPGRPDSGWRFMYGDEDEEYLEDADNTSIVALNTVCNLHPDILAYVHAEVGRGFDMDITGWVEE